MAYSRSLLYIWKWQALDVANGAGRKAGLYEVQGQYGPRDQLLLCWGVSSSAQVTHTTCLGAWRDVASINCLLAGCLLNEGARKSLLLATPARCDEGVFAMPITMPLQGRGDTITLDHPEGPYMQMLRRIRQELNPSGEFGEWIEDVAIHNPLQYL